MVPKLSGNHVARVWGRIFDVGGMRKSGFAGFAEDPLGNCLFVLHLSKHLRHVVWNRMSGTQHWRYLYTCTKMRTQRNAVYL
jgi:hypothetical protein